MVYVNVRPLGLLSLLSFVGTQSAHASSASTGCDADYLGTLSTDETTNVTLGDRWYLLYLPENYTPSSPAPVILSYHGANRDALDQQELDLLSTPYFNKDYIVVYPNAVDVSSEKCVLVCLSARLDSHADFEQEMWQGAPGIETDDLGFTSDILDDVQAQYCIDSDRIFATGKSQGGGFVGVLACDEDLSKRIGE